MNDTYTQRLRVAGIFPVAYLTYAKQLGVDVTSLLQQQGLTQDTNELLKTGLSFAEVAKLLGEQGLYRLCPRADLGFLVVLNMPPTALGPVGMAVMCSATVADAIAIVQRYWDLIGRVMQMTVHKKNEQSVLVFRLEAAVEGVLKRWILEAALASVWRGLVAMVPNVQPYTAISFDFPPANEITAQLGNVQFNAPETSLTFPREFLTAPMPIHSASGLEQALAQCEASMRFLQQEQSLNLRVQDCLTLVKQRYPSLEEVAEQLHLSSRSLRRYLAEEGTSFGALLVDAKRLDALRLLQDERLTIADIAQRLGYQDPANFTRAFRRWVGKTPSAWRGMNETE